MVPKFFSALIPQSSTPSQPVIFSPLVSQVLDEGNLYKENMPWYLPQWWCGTKVREISEIISEMLQFIIRGEIEKDRDREKVRR